MFDPKKVCETSKIINRFKSIMNGKGLLFGREIDKIDYSDKENNKLEWTQLNQRTSNSKELDSYDYVIAIMFDQDVNMIYKDCFEHLLSYLKSNGYLILYIPHKHYYPFNNATIPHDVLIDLKHIDKYMFEITDFQAYGFDGSYETQDHKNVEYGFHVLIKKANNLFGKKDLSDDPGQMMDLE